MTRRVVLLIALAGVLLAVSGAPASAHPLGNFTVSHFSRLEIAPDSVTIRYALDMAEIPTFQERDALDSDGDGRTSGAELDAYARLVAPGLRDGVSLEADGVAISLEVASARARLRPGQGGLDVLRVDATFMGGLTDPEADLVYRDENFPGRIGWREIVAVASPGQGIATTTVPAESVSHGLRSYPRDRLSSPLDVSRADLSVAPSAAGARVPERQEAARSEPVGAIASAFASLVEARVTPGFLVAALALALGAGALHALGPGHGKTVMAAYLVGAEGRLRHAVAVGVAVSLMHTASVVALGLVTLWASHLFAPEAVYPWLSLASGVVVLALGTWLLLARLRATRAAQADRAPRGEDSHGHARDRLDLEVGFASPEPVLAYAAATSAGAVELVGEQLYEHAPIDRRDQGRVAHMHAHAHGLEHHHQAPPEVSPLSARGLAAVALSGGLLPSPSALVVLLGAVALHRVALGVFLVAAFSVGLAAALTAVGVLVLKARSVASRRLGSHMGALVPVASAAAIVAVGLFLTTRALLSF